MVPHSGPTVPRQPVRLPPVFREFVSRLYSWNVRLLAMDFSSKSRQNTPHKSQKHSRPGYACNLRLAATLWFQTRNSDQAAPQESATSGHLMVSSSANISLLSQCGRLRRNRDHKAQPAVVGLPRNLPLQKNQSVARSASCFNGSNLKSNG
jgi:hypothetical protein